MISRHSPKRTGFLAKGAVALSVAGAVAMLVPTAVSGRSCVPVLNPYDGTSYEGVDLTHIKAEHVSCANARRVVEKAHRKALGLAPTPDGYLYLRSDGWDVEGNLRPASDRYVAFKKDKRIRWRF